MTDWGRWSIIGRMTRLLPVAVAALLAASQSGATPPLPPPEAPPLPPDYVPQPPVDGLVFTPLPRHYSNDPRPHDLLGDVWEMREVSSWAAVWLRRGRSHIFDGYWTHPNGERVRTILEIWIDEDKVVALRRHPDGQYCRYDGRLASDWVRIQGQYTCTWERTPMPWQAQIVRIEEVEPAILRERR